MPDGSTTGKTKTKSKSHSSTYKSNGSKTSNKSGSNKTKTTSKTKSKSHSSTYKGNKTKSGKTKSQTKSKSASVSIKSISSKDVPDALHKLRKNSECESLLKKFLTDELYDKLGKRKTSMGSKLKDCIQSGLQNPDSHIGVYCADPECYETFAGLFDPIIEDYHGFSPHDEQPQSYFGDVSKFADLDPYGKYIISTRVRCGRSLRGFPLNPCMEMEHYKEIEKMVRDTCQSFTDEHLKGTYYPLVGMDKEKQQQLIDDHFLFKEGDKYLQAAHACRYWPVGRGIFINDTNTFLVWICEEDHIRIISMQNGGDLKEIYARLVKGVAALESRLKFVHHKRLGYLTFCPTNLGTTIRASVMIKLPKLSSKFEKFEKMAAELKLQIRGSKGEHTESDDGVYDVSNKRRLGLTEFQAVMEMQKGVFKLIKEEKSME